MITVWPLAEQIDTVSLAPPGLNGKKCWYGIESSYAALQTVHQLRLIFSHTQDSGQWLGGFGANEEPVDWEEHQQLFDLQMEVAYRRCHHQGHRRIRIPTAPTPILPLTARPEPPSRR